MSNVEDRWYRTAVEQTPQHAIFGIGLDARIITWNCGAERLFGYSRDEALGQPFAFLFSAEQVQSGNPLRELASAEATGQFTPEPAWAQRKDGALIFIDALVLAVRGASGETEGYFKFAVDRTPEQRLREELQSVALLYHEAQESHRAKDEFLATVSHELRTPLQAILGWSRLLRMGKLDDAAGAKALEIIERSARSQAKLIDDLLDVSRIITGKMAIEPKAVDLCAIVATAIDAARPSAAAKNLRLSSRVEPAASPIEGDPARLQQVFGNLLSNAVKFTPVNGTIQVTLRASGDTAEVSVCDSGAGIDPEFLPHVFERFRQCETGEGKANKGLGLGLAIVRHLVELHGGSVAVCSAGEGKGATFTVRLPLRKVSAAPVSAKNTESSPRSV